MVELSAGPAVLQPSAAQACSTLGVSIPGPHGLVVMSFRSHGTGTEGLGSQEASRSFYWHCVSPSLVPLGKASHMCDPVQMDMWAGHMAMGGDAAEVITTPEDTGLPSLR